jgi:glycosyltransferase involved in cell wall biosynthesis
VVTARGPLVTVVIPTRNRWPLLQRTLGSVLAQQQAPFEVFIVDDGSRPPPRAPCSGDGATLRFD